MKLWGGRFEKETDALVNSFNSSISVDFKMFEEDISGSIAHSYMLGQKGIISKDESSKIIDGLNTISSKIKSGELVFSEASEDIHSFVESNLIDLIGEAGKKLHTARSRNDQVILDLKLYIRKQLKLLILELLALEKSVLNKAEQNIDTIMPGYTHMQKAQPITLSHHLLAYCEMFKRDIGRIEDTYKRTDEMPLGSGALASSTYPIDRMLVATQLGFSNITVNSMDSVSDRDFVIETLSALSIIMMHLSRLSEEIIIWCTGEFDFIELDDAYSTGSSIMPQKKNPDVAELVRGKTGRVYGDLMTVLTLMKGLPLTYNKDMQEDKEALFDALDTVHISLNVYKGMIDTIKVKKDTMRKAAAGGFTNATDVADYLVKKGTAFRDAHGVVGSIVLYCVKNKRLIEELPIDVLKDFSPYFEQDIYENITLEACVEKRNVEGGPSSTTVKKQIEAMKTFIELKQKMQEEGNL